MGRFAGRILGHIVRGWSGRFGSSRRTRRRRKSYKRVNVSETNLAACVDDAQAEPVVLTRDGKAVAIVIATDELDEEQLALGTSDRFWSLIRSRRQEPSMDRAALEERLATGA